MSPKARIAHNIIFSFVVLDLLVIVLFLTGTAAKSSNATLAIASVSKGCPGA